MARKYILKHSAVGNRFSSCTAVDLAAGSDAEADPALADKYFVIAPDSRALKLSVGDYRYLQAVLEYPHAHRRRAPIIS